MRILWLTQNYPPQAGGMAQSCDRIVYHLRNLGMTIDVICLRNKSHKIQSEHPERGRDICWPLSGNPPHAFNQLLNWIKAEHKIAPYSHVLAFGGVHPMTAGRVYAAAFGIPLITCIRGNDFDVGVFDHKRHELLADCCQRSAMVLCVSSDKTDLINALWPNANAITVGNGIDLERWRVTDVDQRIAKNIHAEIAQNDAVSVLGLFGHIKDKKGADFFINTLIQSSLTTRSHLLLVGTIDDDVLEEIAQHNQSNPGSPITYTHIPFVDRYQLIAYYLACDGIVIPSFYDGLPNVVLEAMVTRRPLIASRTAGMADCLDDTRAFLFEPGNAADCSDALQRFFHASPQALDQLTFNACNTVNDQYNAQREADIYLQCFEETALKATACVP